MRGMFRTLTAAETNFYSGFLFSLTLPKKGCVGAMVSSLKQTLATPT